MNSLERIPAIFLRPTTVSTLHGIILSQPTGAIQDFIEGTTECAAISAMELDWWSSSFE